MYYIIQGNFKKRITELAQREKKLFIVYTILCRKEQGASGAKHLNFTDKYFKKKIHDNK